MALNIPGLALNIGEAAKLEILHPATGLPMYNEDKTEKAYVLVLSSDSPKAKAHQRAVLDRRLSAAGKASISAEIIEAEQVDLLAGLITGWKLFGFDGKEIDLPFSEANARALLSEPSFSWLREQVDKFTTNRGNFMPA